MWEKVEEISKYGRYATKIDVSDKLSEIDVKYAKNTWLKDKLYFIKDTVSSVLDYIAKILTS